jgi:hypothetical protein
MAIGDNAIDGPENLFQDGDWSWSLHAPQWARQSPFQATFQAVARGVLAVLLVAGAAWLIAARSGDELPGEAAARLQGAAASESAAKAASREQSALENRRRELVRLRAAQRRQAHAAVRLARATSGRSQRVAIARVEAAKRSVALARSEVAHANLLRAEAAAERRQFAAATATVAATDVDLTRTVGIVLLALLATIAAAALVAYRIPHVLSASVRHGFGAAVDGNPGGVNPAAGQGVPAAAGGDGNAGAAAPPQGQGAAGAGGGAKEEPVALQAGVSVVVMLLGLFGIQKTEGITENLLNLGILTVPVLGALYARNRVTARPKSPPLPP